MHPREVFLNGEIKRIKILLDIFCVNSKTCCVLEDDKRLKKIANLLFEIIEKAKILTKISEDK